MLVWDEVSNSSGGGGGGGNKPSLNTEDHYGYIVGYPVDYETGEPTDDQARKPVKPQGKITRAEVATIFFRMLTDEPERVLEPEQQLHRRGGGRLVQQRHLHHGQRGHPGRL